MKNICSVGGIALLWTATLSALSLAAVSPSAAETISPMPRNASTQLTLGLGKRSLRYTMTAGTVPVRDGTSNIIAEVGYTAYILAGQPSGSRPVSFVFNGGPGAASVFLNLGALGPQRLQFGGVGDSGSDMPQLRDNAQSWLEFTDLVFIDPVGTGYSRSLVPDEQAAKLFWNDTQDPQYLSRVVFDWLKENNRLRSPVYLVGESHSGYRVPKMARILQSQVGLGLSGIVLVSPILDTAQKFNSDLSPIPWMVQLPSMAAAYLDQRNALSAAAMEPVMDYVRGDYLVDLTRGRSDPAALERIVQRVAAFTGLDPAYVRQSGGRIDPQDYVRQLYRTAGRIGSGMDPLVTIVDPFPFAVKAEDDDTLLGIILAPTTSAMVDLYQRKLGWKVDRPYLGLSRTANSAWNGGKWGQFESFTDLREALSSNPDFRVMIAHGWADLSCPFMASELLIESLPAAIPADQVRLSKYPGGHMFYTRMESLRQFHNDAANFYAGR